MAIEAVIFDLYGTLVDIWTDEWDLSTYRHLSQFLSYYNYSFTPEGLAARYQELTANQMLEHPAPYGEIDVFRVFEEILASDGKQPTHAWVLCVARLFRSLSRRRFGLYPDTLPALTQLQSGFQLAIISDAQWVFSEPELSILGVNRLFDPIVLSSRYFVRKPDPQIYAHALKALHLPPHLALYVGDDPEEDLPGPQALGMPVVLVDRLGSRGPQSVPVLRDLGELPRILRQWEAEEP
ncbi:MAG: HAD family hydrolase [Deltaproteobacteria bacterium]|nr:HAD family hydrolase [Deltaproteobacteria bacterium]